VHNYSSDYFDYQIPIGSLPRYAGDNLLAIIADAPKLTTDLKTYEELKSKYIRLFGQDKRLVGISWFGGGRKDRIPNKSISLDTFRPLFEMENCQFISLQYGVQQKHLDKFNAESQANIFVDDTVNPIKDMDRWMAQLECCDHVISIANTTIHGAGWLDKPTLCLLSDKADWRWLDRDVKSADKSYWYPTVSIAHQAEEPNWTAAMDRAVIECKRI